MLSRIAKVFWNQDGLYLGLELFAALVLAVLFLNPVINYLCRKWYGPPSVEHIEFYPKRIRLGDNVKLMPEVEIPCGGKPEWDWRPSDGVVSNEGPPFTLSTQGVREQVPFNITVSLVITDKCENRSVEYRPSAPIEVIGPPRPKVSKVEPDSIWVWKDEPVVLTATAEAGQSELKYEWNIPGAAIDGDRDHFRIKFKMSGVPNPIGYIPVSGSCTAISREGEKSEPLQFTFWVWQKLFPVVRGGPRRSTPRARTKQIITTPGLTPPGGTGQAPAPGAASPNPAGTAPAPPQSPPAPAAKPSP
jgi:hypothetical protein